MNCLQVATAGENWKPETGDWRPENRKLKTGIRMVAQSFKCLRSKFQHAWKAVAQFNKCLWNQFQYAWVGLGNYPKRVLSLLLLISRIYKNFCSGGKIKWYSTSSSVYPRKNYNLSWSFRRVLRGRWPLYYKDFCLFGLELSV